MRARVCISPLPLAYGSLAADHTCAPSSGRRDRRAVRRKGQKTAPQAGARGLSHVQMPPPVLDVQTAPQVHHVLMPPPVHHVRTPPLVCHVRIPPPVHDLRTPIILTLPIVWKMQKNTGENEKTEPSDASLKLVTVKNPSWRNHGHRRKSASSKERTGR